MKVAVVIFLIGEKYILNFNKYFKNSVTNYCNKYKYDLFILNEFIRNEPAMDKKKFYWQRLLIPQKYIDYDTQFEKSYVEPIRVILDCMGWKTEKTSNLEDFFT